MNLTNPTIDAFIANETSGDRTLSDDRVTNLHADSSARVANAIEALRVAVREVNSWIVHKGGTPISELRVIIDAEEPPIEGDAADVLTAPSGTYEEQAIASDPRLHPVDTAITAGEPDLTSPPTSTAESIATDVDDHTLAEKSGEEPDLTDSSETPDLISTEPEVIGDAASEPPVRSGESPSHEGNLSGEGSILAGQEEKSTSTDPAPALDTPSTVTADPSNLPVSASEDAQVGDPAMDDLTKAPADGANGGTQPPPITPPAAKSPKSKK